MRKRDAAAADGGRMKELNRELDQVVSMQQSPQKK